MANRRKLIVEIVGDSSSLERAFGKSGRAAKGFSTSVTASFGQLLKGTLIIDGIQKAVEGLSATFRLGTEEFADNAKVTAQTNAAIKSTGGIAGVTARQIDNLGLSLSNLSGVDDEVVRAGANVLLSFRNIRDQAGKGNDIFTRATKDALDFAVRTGRDVPAAANLLGRALEDPARKAASLARAGIVLSASQLKTIKALEDSGHALDAQKFLLAQVEDRFKGAAEAAGKTLPGQLNILRDRFKDLAGSGIGLVAPAATRAVTAVTDLVKRISEAQGGKAKLNVAVSGLEALGRSLFEQIRSTLERIPFDQLAHTLSGRLGDALSSAARFLGTVNFTKLGKTIVDGIVGFLKSVNWGALLRGAFNLAVAAIKGLAELFLGAGKALGKAIINGVLAGLEAIGRLAVEGMLKLAIKILKPLDLSFTVFGHKISTGLGGVIKSLQGQIDALHGKTITITIEVQAKNARLLRGASGSGDAMTKPILDAAAKAAKSKQKIDTALGLTDVAGNAKAAADAAGKSLQRLLDTLNLAVAKAGLTKTLTDDLRANQALITALEQQVRLHKDDLDLQNQLVSAQSARLALVQQQADLEKAARDARQFRTLGLDATGQALIPLKQGLARQLTQVTRDIAGTFLDTNKTQKLLAAIRKLILNPFTKVSKEVRSTIKQMLDDIENQLKSHQGGPQTKFKIVDTDKVLANLGLSVDQLKRARQRLAQLVPSAGSPGNFNTGVRAGAAFGAGAGVVFVMNGNIVTDNPDDFLRQLQKKAKRTSTQTRGPTAGNSLGIRSQ